MNQALRNNLVYPKETVYFALTILVSISVYISLLFSIIGIVIIATIMLLSYFIHALSMASIRRNGIRISENQFADIYKKAQTLAADMELAKMPSVYILESSGFLNAFATRFFGKNMVVVYSEIFDLSEEDKENQLLFVLAHEFAHLKRRHVLVHLLLFPAMFIPFLGEAYLRACEYTCDRYAAFYIDQLEASKQALTMLAIGKKLAPKVNQEAFINQINEESGFFAWLSEKLSTHPDLPKRLNALDHWIDPEHHYIRKEKKAKVLFGIGGIILIGVIIPVLIVYAVYKSDLIDTLAAFGEDEYSDEYSYEAEGPLLEAAADNDVSTLESLIESGEDLSFTDNDGYTALHWAAYMGSYEAAVLLIENGVDLDAQDDDGSTALLSAVYIEDPDMVKLLIEKGADPDIEDFESYGISDHVDSIENQDVYDLLVN